MKFMGLITKEVEINLNSSNIEHFEVLGYELPKVYDKHKKSNIVKRGTKIKVNVNDLKKGSSYRVDCICDKCNKPLNMTWRAYIEHNHNGNIYCHKCANKLFISGENSPHWKPEKTNEERENNRAYREYEEFVQKVLARDKYTCVITGKTRNETELVVHHLDSYDWCKEKRTDVTNGVTLSKDIHEAFHTKYGRGRNTKEQFLEFVGIYDLILEDYNGEIPTTRWAYCITDNEIIQNINKYAKNHNISKTNIYSCCNGKAFTCFEKIYIWYDVYKQMSKEEINAYIDKCNNKTLLKKVICLNNLQIFKSSKCASLYYPTSASNITACCRNKQKHAGKLLDGTKLKWMYLKDFIEQNKDRIDDMDKYINQHMVKIS